jgi:hypothetical protein
MLLVDEVPPPTPQTHLWYWVSEYEASYARHLHHA